MLVLEGMQGAAVEPLNQLVTLKHDWLKNQILQFGIDGILAAEVKKREGWPVKMQRLLALIGQLESIFSPLRLVQSLEPLREIPPDSRAKIEVINHEAYLEVKGNEVLDLKAKLEPLAKEMETALVGFVKERGKLESLIDASNTQGLQKKAVHLLEKARTIVELLDQLPKGIVLP